MLYTAPFLHFNHVLDAMFLLLQIDPSMIDMSRDWSHSLEICPPDRSFGRPEYSSTLLSNQVGNVHGHLIDLGRVVH